MDEKEKTFHKNAKKLSIEQLVETLHRKNSCNARAQKIVEELIEKNIGERTFLVKINFITQTHYDDVVEERSILRVCGYPLCDKDLMNIPSQKYIISTITNKVYDITDNKKFCTAKCYKASQFIKEQIETSPLWLRDDNYRTKFQLLKYDNTNVDS